MSSIPKEVLRNYIKEQNFTSPNNVLEAMKDMFKDVLQKTLEAELDTQLGYDKNKPKTAETVTLEKQ